MGEQISQRELRNDSTRAVLDVFRQAPRLDWERMKQDLDDVVDQGAQARG